MQWDLVYGLELDLDSIARIQKATLTTENFGLVPDPALFGSPEWWAAIERGDLPTHRLEGQISQVYWGSMADWPEFSLSQDGATSTWTRAGDIARYVEGLRVKLSYVVVRHKPSAVCSTSCTVLDVWIERSRLRSCDVAPGPGGAGFRGLTTLYRPVGDAELTLIEQSGHTRFPPRLPAQPIFYPILDEAYATQIAREWNTKDERSSFVGYVTSFHVRSDFLVGREIHEVGRREHREYWIPAGELESFNANLVGRIEVTAEFGRPTNPRGGGPRTTPRG